MRCKKRNGKCYLLVDVLEWPVGVLAVTNTMASHARLAGELFSLDQHFGGVVEWWRYATAELDRIQSRQSTSKW